MSGMTTTPPLDSDSGRLPTARLAVGYAAIAGTVPYLALKTMWLTGSSVGVTDRVSGAGGAVLNNLLNFSKVLAGLVIGLVLLFVLAERRHPLTDPLGTAPAAAR